MKVRDYIKCETTFESAKARDYKRLKVRKCETTSMHRCRRARLFVDFERRGILGDTRTRSRAKSTTEACISLYVKKIRDEEDSVISLYVKKIRD